MKPHLVSSTRSQACYHCLALDQERGSTQRTGQDAMVWSGASRNDGDAVKFEQMLWLKPLTHTMLGLDRWLSKMSHKHEGTSLIPSIHIKRQACGAHMQSQEVETEGSLELGDWPD